MLYKVKVTPHGKKGTRRAEWHVVEADDAAEAERNVVEGTSWPFPVAEVEVVLVAEGKFLYAILNAI